MARTRTFMSNSRASVQNKLGFARVESKSKILRHEYQLRFSHIKEYHNVVWKILCSEYFSRYIPDNARVLDLGAGWGEFINNIKAAEKYAMDLNLETKERLSAGVIFLNQDSSCPWQIESGSLDIVFSSNFLEHLPSKDHLESTILEANRRLRKGGLIICLGPNIKYLPGAYWDFWDHCIPLSDLSVSELLRMNGFHIDLCIPRFLPYSMSLGRTPSLFLVKLYLRFPWLWPLMGKQFLIIGSKETNV